MGTINFKTSNIITLGTALFEFDNELNMCNDLVEYDETIVKSAELEYQLQYEDYNFYVEDLHGQTTNIIEEYSFYCGYEVKIDMGYYEGFSIYIETPQGYFWDYEEKKEAQKELTKLKEMLIKLVDIGLQACTPFWCTTYFNYNESIIRINKAIKEERERIKKLPTYSNYKKKA